jgi:hypothetical protein
MVKCPRDPRRAGVLARENLYLRIDALINTPEVVRHVSKHGNWGL